MCHTLPDNINGHPTDSEICNPFLYVHVRFMFVHVRLMFGHVRFMSVNPVGSFVHAQNWERMPTDCSVRWLYGYCAPGIRFVRNSFVSRPVRVRLYPLMSGGGNSWTDYYRTFNG